MGWGIFFFKWKLCKAVLTLVWFIAYMDMMCDENSMHEVGGNAIYCSLFYQV